MTINTGLGWECDSSYLVTNYDTKLGCIPDALGSVLQWLKTSDGPAINVFTVSTTGDDVPPHPSGDGWYRGPLLISTNPDYISASPINTRSGTFRYACLTWYWFWSYITGNTWGRGPKEYDAQGRPIYLQNLWGINFPGIRDRDIPLILERAKVKPYRSWKTISFAAGLATGLAARAWAHIGERDVNLKTKFIVANGTYSASDEEVEGYSSVVVNVPNSYTNIDETKVVQNGTLVSQTNQTIIQNGTYNTTTKKQIVVDIPRANGVSF